MLISAALTKNAMENYQRKKLEKYSTGKSLVTGMSAANETTILIASLLFMFLEILALFFAINIALNCTKGGPERIVHFILATVFTLPYLLINVVFNQCAVENLKNPSMESIPKPDVEKLSEFISSMGY